MLILHHKSRYRHARKMRPSLSAAALFAAAVGCTATAAFAPPPLSPSISTSITRSCTIVGTSRVRTRPLASSPDGRYDHFRSSNDGRIHHETEAAAAAYAAADAYISEHLATLPILRSHSGDAQIQRNIEAVRRGIASYYLDATSGAAGTGVNANDDNIAVQQASNIATMQPQPPADIPAAQGALTDYLDGLSSGRFVSTPSSAEAAGAIRSYLDSLPTAMENGASPTTNGGSGGGGSSFGQSSYLQYIDEACDADDPMSAWASIDTNNSGTTPDETTSVPSPASQGGSTTITVGSTTHVDNIEGLHQNLPKGQDGGGVIARSFHEEEGGDTKTETMETQEGEDTVLTVTSTTRIVLPREG